MVAWGIHAASNLKLSVVSALLHISSLLSHALSWSGSVLLCKVPWLGTYVALLLVILTFPIAWISWGSSRCLCCCLYLWCWHLLNSINLFSLLLDAWRNSEKVCAPNTDGAIINSCSRPSCSWQSSKTLCVSVDMFSQPEGSLHWCFNQQMKSAIFSSSHCASWWKSCAASVKLTGSNLSLSAATYVCFSVLVIRPNSWSAFPRRYPAKYNSHSTLVHPFWVATLSNNGN